MEDKKLLIVSMLDPSLCRSCRFGAVANVELQDGSNRRMWLCKRLDCDNWLFEKHTERPVSLQEEK